MIPASEGTFICKQARSPMLTFWRLSTLMLSQNFAHRYADLENRQFEPQLLVRQVIVLQSIRHGSSSVLKRKGHPDLLFPHSAFAFQSTLSVFVLIIVVPVVTVRGHRF